MDPRGREIGDQSGGEDEPGPDGILVAARRDEPLRLDTRELAGLEREHEIDVVDHEIEHDADVERSECERCESRRFDRHDPTAALDGHPPCWIESLHVPHGDNPAMAIGGGHDLVRLATIGGDRLLDQEVETLRQQGERYLGMKAGGGRDDDRISQADEFLRFGKCPTAMCLGDPLPRFGHGIDHGDEFGIDARGEQPGMNSSQMSTPDHSHLRSRHAALLLSRARPCRPSFCLVRNSSSCNTSGSSIPCDPRISRADSSPTFAR